LNSIGTTAYLRGVGRKFGESTNSIRLGNPLRKAGFKSHLSQANKSISGSKHPLFKDINSIGHLNLVGLDHVIDYVLKHGRFKRSVFSGVGLSKGKMQNK